MIAALISRILFEDKLKIGDPDPSSGLQHNGHDHTLVIDQRPIAATQIHNLILESIAETNDRTFTGYIVTWVNNRAGLGTPDGRGVLHYPLKRFPHRRIHTQITRHVPF